VTQFDINRLILHVCVQKFLVRERGKCWNWRTSRYVPTGTRRKERFHMCLQERGGSVGNGGRRAMNICAYLEKKKRKEKKRILRINVVEDLYFILRI